LHPNFPSGGANETRGAECSKRAAADFGAMPAVARDKCLLPRRKREEPERRERLPEPGRNIAKNGLARRRVEPLISCSAPILQLALLAAHCGQLQHGRALTDAQLGQEHDPAIWQRQCIVMHILLILIYLAEPSDLRSELAEAEPRKQLCQGMP